MKKRLIRNERGAALIEAAVTIPIILLISVGILEFAMAFQTWQVLTNAAREGARVAVIEGSTETQIKDAVHNYLVIGNIEKAGVRVATVNVNPNVTFGSTSASEVSITFPYKFAALDPVIRLVSPSKDKAGALTTLGAKALMRNE
jgi:Flp pilus assembly protein TadG